MHKIQVFSCFFCKAVKPSIVWEKKEKKKKKKDLTYLVASVLLDPNYNEGRYHGDGY